MNKKEIQMGAHFWAKYNNRLVMLCKTENGFFACGDWEGSFNEDEFEVVKFVSLPNGYTIKDLYYIS